MGEARVDHATTVNETMEKGVTNQAVMCDHGNLPTLANAATRRQMIIGATSIFGCLALATVKAWPSVADEISHTCESIHQEVVFKASRKRVYEALTDAKQFNKVVLLSAAMQSGAPRLAPTSRDGTLSWCPTKELSKPGARQAGDQANTRLRDSI